MDTWWVKQVKSQDHTHHHDFISQSSATLCDLCASAVKRTPIADSWIMEKLPSVSGFCGEIAQIHLQEYGKPSFQAAAEPKQI